MVIYDTIIIGSGVAGMTAAIYLKRANKNVLILENNAPGGQINKTASIENYPGFIEIDGPSLAMNMFEQIQKLDIEYKYGDVINIENNVIKKVITTDNTYQTKNIIIASGRNPKGLGLEYENQLTGRGISWCSICDGPLYKNKIVAVIGGGNSAFEESIYLSNIAKKVYLIHRTDKFRAEASLVEKVKQNENIEIITNSNVTKLNIRDDKLYSINLNNAEELVVEGMFIYIGYTPNSKFLTNINIELENGYIKTDEFMQTNIDGIYAIGDVRVKDFYQISTAVGDGANAALMIVKKLNN